jgi:DNA-binding response OmpR family regulator
MIEMTAKILVVDDEPNLLRLIGYALHSEGYETIVATDGEEALKKVQSEKPDLVILDVMLPDMSGIEICQRLRSRPETNDLPIIMLSARVQVSDKITGLEAGADEYVTKPVETEEMVARVAALLERTHRLRRTQPAKQGKVLGFIGAKGGVGTTTVALNVALVLAGREHVVAALELRSYFGTFGQHLGRTPVENLTNLLELEPERIDEREVKRHLAKHPTGLQILFGPQKVDSYQEIKPDQAGAVVKGLTGIADYTVIDLPCHPNEVNRTALRLCDFVTVVVEPEPTAVASAKVTLELLKTWGVGGEMVGAVIVNRVSWSAPMTLTQIESALGCRIVGTVPPTPDLCMKALEWGSALVVYRPDSTAASALAELADRFAGDRVKALAF